MNSRKNGFSARDLYSLTKMTGSPVGPTMKRHLDVEIRSIKEDIIRMGGMVEHAIDRAIRSLKESDAQLAQRVINNDAAINELEIQIESECRSLLARHQPVANDLRFIMASVKINNDLERMGDHAVNIAQGVRAIRAMQPIKPSVDIPYLASLVQKMVKDSLDAFVMKDVSKAEAVCNSDDHVDELEGYINRVLLTYMLEDHTSISQGLHLSMICKNLERIADLSTNVGEEVIYLVEAKTIKHQYKDHHVKEPRSDE